MGCRYRSGDTLSKNTANMAGAYEEMVLPVAKSLETCIAEVEERPLIVSPGEGSATTTLDTAPATTRTITTTQDKAPATTTTTTITTLANTTVGALQVGDTIWLRA